LTGEPLVAAGKPRQFPARIEIKRLTQHVFDIGAREPDVLEHMVVKVRQSEHLPALPPVTPEAAQTRENPAALEGFGLAEDVIAHGRLLPAGCYTR